jgi:hypothetical protein
VIYFTYSYRHSRLRTGEPLPDDTQLPEEQR